AMDSNTLEL
nr:Chain C, H5N1 INFLUENZA A NUCLEOPROTEIN [Influenza A virus]2X4S_F Chain F, H5N1 INFLUENZA A NUCLEOPROTEIN [Influenza A virus]